MPGTTPYLERKDEVDTEKSTFKIRQEEDPVLLVTKTLPLLHLPGM